MPTPLDQFTPPRPGAPISARTHAAVFEAVKHLYRSGGYNVIVDRFGIHIRRPPATKSTTFNAFDAIVTGAIGTISPGRWLYSWQEAIYSRSTQTFVAKPGGRSNVVAGYDDVFFAAINGLENSNDGLDIEGTGVDLTPAEKPYTLEQIAVANSPRVLMFESVADDGLPAYSFSAPNPYVPTCVENTGPIVIEQAALSGDPRNAFARRAAPRAGQLRDSVAVAFGGNP